MSQTEPKAVNDADREIVTSRVLDAPRALVWKAWTDPLQVALWWGPRGYTNTVHEMSVRPGGVWRLTMHDPDGTNYPNRIVYEEVVEPERLLYTHSGDDSDPVVFHVTVTFEEQRGKTRLTMRARFETAAIRDEVAEKHGAVEGAIQTLARLAEHLAER